MSLLSLLLPAPAPLREVGGSLVNPAKVVGIQFDMAPLVDPERASPNGPFCFIQMASGATVIARCTVEQARDAIFGSAAEANARTLAKLDAVLEVASVVIEGVEMAINALRGGEDTPSSLTTAENALVGEINALPSVDRAPFLDDVLTNVMNRQVQIGEITGTVEPLDAFTGSYNGDDVEATGDLFFRDLSPVDRVRLITFARELLAALTGGASLATNPAPNAPDGSDTDTDTPADGPGVDADDDGGGPVPA